MPKRYANYTVSDFDRYDCLKISFGIYAIVAFILRGYLVWLISVTNMRDRIGLMQWLYPEPPLFYLSLVSGAMGLLLLLVLSLRRPTAAPWLKSVWRHFRAMLIFALLFDLLISVAGYFYFQLWSVTGLMVQVMIVLLASWFLYRNARVQINLQEFPTPIAEP